MYFSRANLNTQIKIKVFLTFLTLLNIKNKPFVDKNFQKLTSAQDR